MSRRVLLGDNIMLEHVPDKKLLQITVITHGPKYPDTQRLWTAISLGSLEELIDELCDFRDRMRGSEREGM